MFKITTTILFTCKRNSGKTMTKPIAIRVKENTYERLKNLSEATGRSTTFYIHEAIEEHLDDLEDIYFAERALEALKRGDDEVIDGKEFWNDMGN